MLRITKIDWFDIEAEHKSPIEIYEEDEFISLTITAPLYWWIDTDFFSENSVFNIRDYTDLKFCFDEWTGEKKITDIIGNAVTQAQVENYFEHGSVRKLFQILPLGIMITASVTTTYVTLVRDCEEYLRGKGYTYTFAEREWKDFYETLLDIKGIRELAGGTDEQD